MFIKKEEIYRKTVKRKEREKKKGTNLCLIERYPRIQKELHILMRVKI